jgi:hypothetical protein
MIAQVLKWKYHFTNLRCTTLSPPQHSQRLSVSSMEPSPPAYFRFLDAQHYGLTHMRVGQGNPPTPRHTTRRLLLLRTGVGAVCMLITTSPSICLGTRGALRGMTSHQYLPPKAWGQKPSYYYYY